MCDNTIPNPPGLWIETRWASTENEKDREDEEDEEKSGEEI
jgi:hypothetical protein